MCLTLDCVPNGGWMIGSSWLTGGGLMVNWLLISYFPGPGTAYKWRRTFFQFNQIFIQHYYRLFNFAKELASMTLIFLVAVVSQLRLLTIWKVTLMVELDQYTCRNYMCRLWWNPNTKLVAGATIFLPFSLLWPL